MKPNKYHKRIGDVTERGALKWQGMMLTEHNRMLQEWREADDDAPEPNLTEEDWRLIQENLEMALSMQCEVNVHTWKDKRVTEHRGRIERVDAMNRKLILSSGSVWMNEIVKVDVLE